MQSRQLQEGDQYLTLFQLAFLDGDEAEMRRQVSATDGKPPEAEILLLFQAQTEAGRGRMKEARRLIRRAVELAASRHEDEPAAVWQAQGALFEAEFGDRHQAAARADSALRLSQGKDVRILAALALARAGEVDRAREMTSKLKRDYADDTMMLDYWLPSIDADMDLERADPGSAVSHLEIAREFELGQSSSFQVTALGPMYPVLLRGEALLKSGKSAEAATEFRKFQQHPGVVQSYPLGILARLGLARALAAEGDIPSARAAYRDFLTQWKDADPDLPVLLQARRENARMPSK
jgi:tetratricopeptide (TPR) repeat protein